MSGLSSRVMPLPAQKQFALTCLERPCRCRVGGVLAGLPVRWVACGLNFTVAASADGRAFQAGTTGAPADRRAPWEGALSFEQVPCSSHHPF